MTQDHDPLIRGLFEAAGHDSTGNGFIAGVMAKIEAARRRTIITWGCVALALIGIGWVFTPAVVDAVEIVTRILPQSLIQWEDPDSLFARLFAPVNTVAVPVAILLLVIRKIYKLLS